MKFGVEHDALADAVAWVARELPTRPVVPVLSGLRVEAGQDGLALSCFDYDLAAAARLPADVSEPGTALVPGRLLADITRSLPDEPAEISADGQEMTLRCGSAEFALVSLPLAEYPAAPPVPPLAGVIDGGELAAAIAQVLPAASRDDTLPVLTAVSLEIDGDEITLAATDRYRLAVRQLAWRPAFPGIRALALVPARTLADAARVMSSGVPVSVALAAGQPGDDGGESGRADGGTPSADSPGADGGTPSADGREGPRTASAAGGDTGEAPMAEGMISFDSGGRWLAGRLLGGDFIRYESRFPASFTCQADLAAAAFTEAVRRVALVADRASPVQLTFTDGKVVVEARTEGRARAVETVTASFRGDAPAIAFNPQYLLEGLTAAAAGEGASGGAAIRLRFTSPAKPALITVTPEVDGPDAPAAAPSYRYLVVPQRPPGGD